MLRQTLNEVRDVSNSSLCTKDFSNPSRNILRMAAREGVELLIPSVLPDEIGV